MTLPEGETEETANAGRTYALAVPSFTSAEVPVKTLQPVQVAPSTQVFACSNPFVSILGSPWHVQLD